MHVVLGFIVSQTIKSKRDQWNLLSFKTESHHPHDFNWTKDRIFSPHKHNHRLKLCNCPSPFALFTNNAPSENQPNQPAHQSKTELSLRNHQRPWPKKLCDLPMKHNLERIGFLVCGFHCLELQTLLEQAVVCVRQGQRGTGWEDGVGNERISILSSTSLDCCQYGSCSY